MKQLKSISHVSILISVFTILFLSSCDNYGDKSQKKSKKVIINESVFINYATSGNISSEDHINIEFSREMELIKNSGGLIEEDIIDFDPEIKGKLYLKNPSAIEFIPDEKLKNGESYEAVLDLSKLFVLPEGEEADFDFSFNIFPLRITVSPNNPKVYVKDKQQFNSLDGTIRFSDLVDYNNAIKVLKAYQNNIELHIDYPNFMTSSTLNFNIQGIKRAYKEEKVVLKWDGSEIGSKDSGEQEITIAARDAFKLTGIRVVETPSQYVEVSFSDPIDESMNLNGLINLSGLTNLKYDINTNKILVYTEQHESGERDLIINKELRNIDGKSLKSDTTVNFRFGQVKPQIRFIDDGIILPGKEKWLLTFEAVNLTKVDVIIHEIFANNVKQFMQVNNINGNYQLQRVAQKIYSEQLDLIPNK